MAKRNGSFFEKWAQIKDKRLLAGTIVLIILLSFAAGMAGGLLALHFPAAQSEDAAANPNFPTDTDDLGFSDAVEADDEDAGDSSSAFRIYDRAAHCTVGISAPFTKKTGGLFKKKTQTTASGTGFFISDTGYIATSYHVIEQNILQNAGNITVTTCTGKVCRAEVRGTDPAKDLAVLKIDGSVMPVTFGSSDALQVGDPIIVVGNALSFLSYTCTTGVVSFRNRTVISPTGRRMLMFQTDAAINEGNSGGPVFNEKGEVVGIAAMKYADASAEGLGFFLPIDEVLDSLNQLMQTGKVERAGLGVEIGETPSEDPQGIPVTAISDGSAAGSAGIKAGDVITEIDGAGVKSVSSLLYRLRGKHIGDTVQVTVSAGGSLAVYEVTLKALEETEDSGAVV
ncbi:MAG: trypsin-like peptidase domain-containing protein [Clostridia bacterium]|nr:trypsin-like peptidase domain-containing protein [Clostridia bacterium]